MTKQESPQAEENNRASVSQGRTGPSTGKVTIKLAVPLQRDNATIERVTIHEPTSGNLRGCNLNNIANLDIDTIKTILPRVSEPIIHANELDKLDRCNWLPLGLAIASFFSEPGPRAEAHAEMEAKA